VRAAAGEQVRCHVIVDAALGQNEGRNRIEAGFLEGIETPVEHALLLALAGKPNQLLLHTDVFGANEAALNGRR
jgi:hypothetical protein